MRGLGHQYDFCCFLINNFGDDLRRNDFITRVSDIRSLIQCFFYLSDILLALQMSLRDLLLDDVICLWHLYLCRLHRHEEFIIFQES
jgi:hypothetical protein